MTEPLTPPLPGRPRYRDVLRDCPGFRLLFFARAISLGGDWFSMIAVIALLREVTGSDPQVLSGVLILKLLPFFLAGPIAGVVADRFDRKLILVAADLVRVGFVLALLAAPAMSRPVGYVYALVILQVVASAFFEPARSAAIPNLVPDRYLTTANALGAVMWSVVFAIGAAAGGIVTGLVGWRIALAVDALTYVVSAVLVARISVGLRPRRRERPLDWKTLTGARDLWEGARFIAHRPTIATVLFVKTGWGVAGAIALLLTLFGERIYPVGGSPDLGVAMLYTARAIGTALGPILARRLVQEESGPAVRRLLGIAFFWPAVFYGAFAAVHDPVVAVLCVIAAHCGGSVLWVYSSVLLQRLVPDAFRGRVMAADLGLATLMISASTWVYGRLAAMPGADLRRLTGWMAASVLVPTAIWIVASARWPVEQAACSEAPGA